MAMLQVCQNEGEMDKELAEQIKENIDKESTDELLRIWIENDRKEWTDETFDVVKQVLIQRGEKIPEQKKPTFFDMNRRNKKYYIAKVTYGIMLILLIFSLYVIIGYHPRMYITRYYFQIDFGKFSVLEGTLGELLGLSLFFISFKNIRKYFREWKTERQ
jgi:hypothetical protein